MDVYNPRFYSRVAASSSEAESEDEAPLSSRFQHRWGDSGQPPASRDSVKTTHKTTPSVAGHTAKGKLKKPSRAPPGMVKRTKGEGGKERDVRVVPVLAAEDLARLREEVRRETAQVQPEP